METYSIIPATRLHRGIKNLRCDPGLPGDCPNFRVNENGTVPFSERKAAFVTNSVLKVFVEKFNLAPVTTAEASLQAILGFR